MSKAAKQTGPRIRVQFDCLTLSDAPVSVCGDAVELGEWDIDRALPMAAQSFSSGHWHWSVDVELPARSTVQFKFLSRLAHGVMWESGGNRIVHNGTHLLHFYH